VSGYVVASAVRNPYCMTRVYEFWMEGSAVGLTCSPMWRYRSLLPRALSVLHRVISEPTGAGTLGLRSGQVRETSFFANEEVKIPTLFRNCAKEGWGTRRFYEVGILRLRLSFAERRSPILAQDANQTRAWR
jgi:hypothetical protein